MNDKFIKKIKELNITPYRISQDTGLSYTTLNELVNGKISINNVAAEKVYRLCLYLGCDMNEVLNNFSPYDKIKGYYKGHSYHWAQNNKKLIVSISKNKKHVINDSIKVVDLKEPYKFAKLYSEAIIDKYIKEKEKDALYEKLYTNAQKR